MSDRHHWRARRAYPWVLALFAAAVLQSEPPAFAVITAYPSEARASFGADVIAKRRCKWTPKQEVCDWVEDDHKQKKSG